MSSTTSLYADTVYTNANVITVDEDFSLAQAIAVKGDRIVAVGSDDEVRAFAGESTEIVDLAGKTVMPGFIDTHGHIALFGLDMLMVDLNGAMSVSEICERISARAAETPAGEPILTTPMGEHPYFFEIPQRLAEGRVPTRYELDEAAPDHPVYITAPGNRVPNIAVFNSRALELAGLTKDSCPAGPPNRVQITPEAYWLDGIEVVRDPATGEPTGELRNMQPLYNPSTLYEAIAWWVPKPTYSDVRAGIAKMAPDFLSWGATTLLENHLTHVEELRAYAELKLPQRIFFTYDLDLRQPLEAIEENLRTIAFATGEGFVGDKVGVVGVSVGLDGPPWHGTAFMGEPYMGPFGTIVNPGPLVPPDHFKAVIKLANRYGFRLHIECAGRGSIGLALDALSEANEEQDLTARRCVIEHCIFPTPEHIAECKRLGVVPATATNFIWGEASEVYVDRLGMEYAEKATPLRSWIDGGLPVCQETDWGPQQAMFTLWQSIARKSGLNGEVIGPDERITREESIRMFTNNGAYALFMEDRLGSIEAGKLADLVVLADDPLTCEEDAIKDIEVVTTIIGGSVVFSQEESGTEAVEA
jgi:predicted amidohydrolase YtcJ